MAFSIKAMGSAFRMAVFGVLAAGVLTACTLQPRNPVKAEVVAVTAPLVPPVAQPPAPPAAPASAAVAVPASVPASAPPQPEPEPDLLEPILAFADRIRGLAGAELVQEISRQGDPPKAEGRLRLAIALGQTRQLYDLVRAQDLLQRVLSDASRDAVPLHPFTRLLAARFAEQRRAEDVLDRQNQQVRDMQRRLDQTQEKLDALREIERSLSSRPPAAPASAPNGRVRTPGS